MIDSIVKGTEGIVGLLTFWRRERRQKTEDQQKAFEAVLRAALMTRAYLADCAADTSKSSRARDIEIMNLWLNACSALYLVDSVLADRCMIKADCWSDPRLWEDPRYAQVPLDIDSMISSCRGILADAPPTGP